MKQLFKNFRSLGVMVLAFSAVSCASSRTKIDTQRHLGGWVPVSMNHLSLLGDLEVYPDHIFFAKTGEHSFQILSRAGDEYILQVPLADPPRRHSYPIVRLGPFNDDGDMEVAFYPSAEEVVCPATSDSAIRGASSWGIYCRP